MSIRLEKKQQTRQALMDAALAWVDEGQDFSSISIREVAKRAGVVPTAFYRHFTDMEDVALNLVDELSIALRKLMREARQKSRITENMIADSVNLYVANLLSHKALFRFMSQALSGGSATLRRAVRNEMQFFARELEADVRAMGLLPNLSAHMLQWVTQLVINTVAGITLELLDIPDNQPSQKQELIEKTICQVKIVLIGSVHWKEPTQPPQ